ncbi:hypothetical protein [Alkalicoccobacillus gibsonii]
MIMEINERNIKFSKGKIVLGSEGTKQFIEEP